MIEKLRSVGLPPVTQGTVPQGPPSGNAAGFSAALEQAQIRFSAHAQQRLASVHLDPSAMSRLEAAVDKAGQKGGRESLILLDDLAFVVSVKNRTVITAVGADRMADNVFTNIDSVVIAKDLA
jgi:flagellar operon protein